MADAPADSVDPGTPTEWRAWLAEHHDRGRGVWLVMRKKGAGERSLDYDAAVTEALAFGWIDSKPRSLDERRSLLWFAPRKAGSGWSRANKLRIARLEAEGRMAPAGLRKVEAARLDGSWELLDAVEDLVVPEDLAAALAALAPAAERFAAFPRSARRSILEWIAAAKRPETRAKRIAETATLAERNERANQWRRP